MSSAVNRRNFLVQLRQALGIFTRMGETGALVMRGEPVYRIPEGVLADGGDKFLGSLSGQFAPAAAGGGASHTRRPYAGRHLRSLCRAAGSPPVAPRPF